MIIISNIGQAPSPPPWLLLTGAPTVAVSLMAATTTATWYWLIRIIVSWSSMLRLMYLYWFFLANSDPGYGEPPLVMIVSMVMMMKSSGLLSPGGEPRRHPCWIRNWPIWGRLLAGTSFSLKSSIRPWPYWSSSSFRSRTPGEPLGERMDTSDCVDRWDDIWDDDNDDAGDDHDHDGDNDDMIIVTKTIPGDSTVRHRLIPPWWQRLCWWRRWVRWGRHHCDHHHYHHYNDHHCYHYNDHHCYHYNDHHCYHYNDYHHD